MRTFVSCLTAALFFVAGSTFTGRAEADLIRLKDGGEIRCRTIWKEGTTVNCAWSAGDLSFPETMIKEIVADDDAGAGQAVLDSAHVSAAKTYGRGTREQALVGAVAARNVDAVKRLIEGGADINGLYYWAPRIEAPPGLHGATVYVPRSSDSTHSGNTPLMLAASQGNAAMVQLLLEKGANPNVRSRLDDKGRSSALCRAVDGHSSNQQVVRLILSRHPDTESIETAFASIAENKYKLRDYIDIFLEHGISARCRDRVLMNARKRSSHIAYLLEEAYRKHDKSAQRRE